MGNAFREPGTIISCPQQTGRKGSNMGILDDAVKKQIELQQEETKDVLTELSRDELIRRRKEDIGNELMPIILQALREFPDAMRELGTRPLPFVSCKRSLLLGKKFEYLEGYYIDSPYKGYFELFMSTDGRFFRGEDVPIEEPGMMIERGNISRPAHFNPDRILFTEEIEEGTAAEVLAERILSKREFEKILKQEDGSIDCEKAVVERFTEFMKQNSDIRSQTSYRGFDELYDRFWKKR
jgi:hypothetical protein